MSDTDALLLRQDLTRDDLVLRLRAMRQALSREGVTGAALIGSRARRDNRPDSDIDLMIEVDPARRFSIFELIGVKHLVEDEIGLPVDVVMRRSLKPDFLARASRDAVEIF